MFHWTWLYIMHRAWAMTATSATISGRSSDLNGAARARQMPSWRLFS